MNKYLRAEEKGSKPLVLLAGVEKADDLAHFSYLVIRSTVLLFKNNCFIDISFT